MFAPVFRLVYSADWAFCLLKQRVPKVYVRMIGIPKGYPRSPREAEAVAAGSNLFFPLKPRRDGAVFDGFISNLAADRFPLEQLTVPTIVINARDDTSFAPYRTAVEAATRIPGAKLITIEGGGHWFMGHDAEFRAAVEAFVAQVT